jgi:hypothetical protein
MQLKKAQAASESLLILGFITMLLVPTLFYFLLFSGENLAKINEMQAIYLIGQISDTAGEVWYSGVGAKKSIIVFYPQGLKNIYFGGDSPLLLDETEKRRIVILAEIYGKEKTFVGYSPAIIKNYPLGSSILPSGSSSLNYKPDRNNIFLPSGLVILYFEHLYDDSLGDYILVKRMNR